VNLLDTQFASSKRWLALLLVGATLGLFACQDGGLVGTGTRPINSPLGLRYLPSDITPDFPASTADAMANLQLNKNGAETRAPARWTHPETFLEIQSADAELSELFALLNSVMDDLVRRCEHVNTGENCVIPADQLTATYTEDLIDSLMEQRLSSTAVAQLTTAGLAELVSALTSHYDAKVGTEVVFDVTTFSRENDTTDVRMLETSTPDFFDGMPVRARWSEDDAWVEVRHRADSVGVSADVFFRFEQAEHYDVLTHIKTASTDTLDYEASLTLIGRQEETPTVMWSAHELGIRNEYGVVSISTKGRADALGAYSRRRLHSTSSPDMPRILDYEASYGEFGDLLASRYCTGDLDYPICTAPNRDITDNSNYVDFDDEDNSIAFLPDAHTSRWKVKNLPTTVSRFAVFRQISPNPDVDLPLCRGYRLGARKAVLHCAALENDLAGADVHLFEILPTATGQQFLLIPDATLVRAVTARNTIPAY